MDLLLIVLLTVLNAAFAMSEMALAASRKARLMAMQESGDTGAAAALRLLDNPTQFLSTVQVGITSIGMLNGIVGEAAFSGPVAQWLVSLGMHEGAASITATALVVTLITFTTIIFGELVPKRIGQLFPETTARWVAPPMRWVATVTKPFVALLALCTQAVLKALRIDDSSARAVTEEEISASLAEGVDAGLIPSIRTVRTARKIGGPAGAPAQIESGRCRLTLARSGARSRRSTIRRAGRRWIVGRKASPRSASGQARSSKGPRKRHPIAAPARPPRASRKILSSTGFK